MEIRAVPLSQLTLAAYNPRVMPAHEMDALKSSLQEFGLVEPILINQDFTVIGGHQRVQAAHALGWTELPCVQVDLPKSKERLLNLALNRIHGEWDEQKLAQLVAEIDQAQEADLQLSGFNERELNNLLTASLLSTNRHRYADETPSVPAPKDVVSCTGEIYALGPHRLLCGDATEERAVAELFGKERASLLHTDPPYFVDYTGAARPGGGKDWSAVYHEVGRHDAEAFLTNVFHIGQSVCATHAAYYCWHSHRRIAELLRAWQALGILPHQQLVWVKTCVVISFSFYAWRHESCLFGWAKSAKPPHSGMSKGLSSVWVAGFDKPGDPSDPAFYSDVWELDYDGKAHNDGARHPTQKPVRLFEIPLQIHTRLGDLCYEPCAGSGSQLIAAEQLRRRCYAVELAPAFCDVIRDRYARFTGEPKWAAHPDAIKETVNLHA